ncbi:MAG: hypothetical protein HW416_2719, partial [Chloroflexi bacterium]|nr:hypothetical protein [Chloroflexota bacterium]
MLAEIDQRHVRTSEIQLASGANAFLAKPDAPGGHPAVVLLHERYGLVQHTRDLAVRFAADGHVALAPNVYWREPDQESLARGEGRATTPDREICDDVAGALDYLKTLPEVDSARLAVMGACASGRHSILVAAERTDVAACVVLYGAVGASAWEPVDTLSEHIGRLKAPLFGVFGEKDHIFQVPGVRRLRTVLEAAGRSHYIRIFRDMPHGWLNDTIPPRYHRTEAEEVWRLLQAFLARVYAAGY